MNESGRRGRVRGWLWIWLVVLAVWPSVSWAPPDSQVKPVAPASSFFDPRLSALRRASVSWAIRGGPDREVVDVVCLVPDVPTFLEALGFWDAGHAFPILIEDTEQALRFLRAFQPARVVRYGGTGKKTVELKPDELWERGRKAVGRAWRAEDQDESEVDGESFPKGLGPTPPGVVAADPSSGAFAGSVALAAGRFQPLVRWEYQGPRNGTVSMEEAVKLALELETKVSALAPKHGVLGDDCDFVTLGGPWPRRYSYEAEGNEGGDRAFDDLLGRVPGEWTRWAYVGRLEDDAKESVYQAMCSLFLQPESALLFNGYDEENEPRSIYRMNRAARRLSEFVKVDLRTGEKEGSLAGWHRAFNPINRYGLVLINSSGGGENFSTRGRGGQTSDVPMSVPAALIVIHSFSAVDPEDEKTLAGRWLSNGVFLYFGALNEPYLTAFRTPTLEADLLAEGLPISAVVRKLKAEDPGFGQPWRLHLLGDPLYRLDSAAAQRPRLPTWEPVKPFKAYVEFEPPPPSSPDLARLKWCLETGLVHASRRQGGRLRLGWEAVMLSIDRSALPEGKAREVYDDLLADLVTFARPGLPWKARVDTIPEPERSSALRRSVQAREALRVDEGSVRRD